MFGYYISIEYSFFNGVYRLLMLFTVLIGLSSCNKLYDAIPPQVDLFLGEQFSKQIIPAQMDGYILDSIKRPEVYAYLHQIKNHILSSPSIRYKDEFVWKLHVVQNDSVLNAFCVAGGYIYVYTGIIKFLDSEAELAGVLAHEIAHADCRHTTLRMINQYGISFIIGMITGGDASFIVNIIENLLGLSFSRADERQADEMAVTYLYSTPYDPRAVGGFFKKIVSEKRESAVPEFLSTHPASDNRIELIEKKWNELGAKKGEWMAENHQRIKQLLP